MTVPAGVDTLLFSRPLHAEAGDPFGHRAQAFGSRTRAVDRIGVRAGADLRLERRRRHAGARAATARAAAAAQRCRATPRRRAPAWSRRGRSADAGRTHRCQPHRGDRIAIAALYLSQRELVRALLDAARRGVNVRLLLDPGKDGYGYEHSGIPNRQVASELIAAQRRRDPRALVPHAWRAVQSRLRADRDATSAAG